MESRNGQSHEVVTQCRLRTSRGSAVWVHWTPPGHYEVHLDHKIERMISLLRVPNYCACKMGDLFSVLVGLQIPFPKTAEAQVVFAGRSRLKLALIAIQSSITVFPRTGTESATMASITIRNLEDDIKQHLRVRAAEHGR